MAIKSIVEVDVKDAGFKEFNRLAASTDKMVKALPSAWKAAAREIEGPKKSFAGIVAGLTSADRISSSIAEKWERIATRARAFSTTVSGAFSTALRFIERLGVVGLLGGGGGLYGLDRLAGGVFERAKTAQGLGLRYGEGQAFELGYGRLLGSPEGFLGSISELLRDPQRRYALMGMQQFGLSPQTLQRGQTGEVASALIPALKRFADATAGQQDQLTVSQMRAYGLEHAVSLQDILRFRSASTGDIAGWQRQEIADRRRLGLSEENIKKWQEFYIQLDRASKTLGTTISDRLSPLAEPLSKLSTAFVDAVDTFLKSDGVQHWLKELGDSLKQLAINLAKPEFQQGVKDFTEGVAAVGKAIGGAFSWLKENPPTRPEAPAGYVTTKGGMQVAPGGFWHRVAGEMGLVDRHNPVGLRYAGEATALRTFGSDEEAIRTLASELRRGASGSTLQYGGMSVTNDTATLARLISSITKQEGVHYYRPEQVRVILENKIGTDVVTQTRQVAGSRQ